jgi:cobyrinic acid a,c-diamide synthase
MSALRALLIAGTHSGCGKTSVTLGLMTALRKRGLTVQGFKCGPDFIDPGLHGLATGRTSHNLDAWMLPAHSLQALFQRAGAGADVAVVEGAMGLFDGQGACERGSSAEIATLLDLPVVLVVDARAMGRSVAALVHGFASFDPTLAIAGVLVNQVASSRHQAILTEALAALPSGPPLLGCLGRAPEITLPSRHLGLVTAQDLPQARVHLERLAQWVEASGAVDRLLALVPTRPAPAAVLPSPAERPQPAVPIGVAQDAAFCFAYAENLRLLEASGARLIPFSPLRDTRLPAGIQGLYLCGGYPELHAAPLAANSRLREEIRAFCASHRPVWAECGGFMYLGQTLTDIHGHSHPMVGHFQLHTVMESTRQALGYRQVTIATPCPLGEEGETARGHEFHYSRVCGHDPEARPLFGSSQGDTGWVKAQVCGTYVHLHLGSNPRLAAHFTAACRTCPPWPRR